MASYYDYNGILLPRIGNSGSMYHHIIYRNPIENAYVDLCLWRSRCSILYGQICFSNTVTQDEVYVKFCFDGSDEWVINTFTIPEPEEGTTHWSVAPAENLIWSEDDIYTISNDPNAVSDIYLAASDPVFVADIEFGWSDGSGISETKNITAYSGFSLSVRPTVKVRVPGGETLVQWYENGNAVETDSSTSSSFTANHYPIDVMQTSGSYTYCCAITNAEYTITTNTITLTVVPYSSGGDGGDDGGGGGGTGGGGDSGGTVDEAFVTDIVLTITPDTVAPGEFAVGNVTVNGTGDFNKGFVAAISEQTSSNTFVVQGEKSCNIWVGEDETADFILVTVTSIHDLTTATAEILYIDHSGTEVDPGTTEEQHKRAFWSGYAAAKAYFKGVSISATAELSVDQSGADDTTPAGKLKRSFWQGFVTGLVHCASATLIAYLYNGERLPPLPEWDKEKYPYAMIGLKDISNGVVYELVVTDTEVYFGNTNTLNIFPFGGYTASSWRYYPDDPDRTDWVPTFQDVEGAKWSFDTDYGLTWSSFDVYRVGELYCAKSEPVPVYE